MDSALVIFSQKVAPRLEEIGKQATSLVDQQSRDLAAASAASVAKSANKPSDHIRFVADRLRGGRRRLLAGASGQPVVTRARARMADGAENVSSAASQVSRASQMLAEGATQQAASLEETSSSTEEIASITRKNADHALQVAGLMQQSAVGAGEVNRSLDRMVEQMKEIDTSSTKIARIIKVIDEIAFQTNILALKRRWKRRARAKPAWVRGSRGRSAELGAALRAGGARYRGADRGSIATSHDGNARLDQMAGAVRAMTDNASRVKALVDEVNLGSQEQSRGMDQISRSVLQMGGDAEEWRRAPSRVRRRDGVGESCRDTAATLVHEMREMVGAGNPYRVPFCDILLYFPAFSCTSTNRPVASETRRTKWR